MKKNTLIIQTKNIGSKKLSQNIVMLKYNQVRIKCVFQVYQFCHKNSHNLLSTWCCFLMQSMLLMLLL